VFLPEKRTCFTADRKAGFRLGWMRQTVRLRSYGVTEPEGKIAVLLSRPAKSAGEGTQAKTCRRERHEEQDHPAPLKRE